MPMPSVPFPIHPLCGQYQLKTKVSVSRTRIRSRFKLTHYPNDAVARLADDGGILAAHGPAGTGLIFGDLMVHGSPANMSPWDRRVFSLILNPVANRQTTFKRPDYQHHRDFSPVVALADDCLLAERVTA